MEFRNRDLGLVVLIVLGCDCFQALSVNRIGGKVYIYVDIYICIYVYM